MMRATGSPREPARGERARSAVTASSEQLLRRRDRQAGMIEPERVTDQNARIELGRIDTRRAEPLRRRRAAPARSMRRA